MDPSASASLCQDTLQRQDIRHCLPLCLTSPCIEVGGNQGGARVHADVIHLQCPTVYHDLLDLASRHPQSRFTGIDFHIDVRQDRGCPGDDGLLTERLLGILLTYFYTMDYVVNPTTNLRQKCTTAMWTCVMAEKFALHGLQRRALAQLETLLMGPCHADTDLMVDLIDIAYAGVVPTLRWVTNSDDNDQEEDDSPADGLADRADDGSPSHDGDCELEVTGACGYADLIDVVNMRASPPEALSTLSSCEVCRRLRSKFPRLPSTPRVAELALCSYLSSYLDYFRRSPEFMDRVRQWGEFAVDLIQASVGVREVHRVSGACDIPRTG